MDVYTNQARKVLAGLTQRGSSTQADIPHRYFLQQGRYMYHSQPMLPQAGTSMIHWYST